MDLTAVIPCRAGHPHRLENTLAVSQYLLDHVGLDQVILVENDRRPRLLHLVDPRIRYLFVQDTGEEFSRAVVFNTALHWVRTTYVAIWDADCIISPPHLRAVMQKLPEDDIVMASPFSEMHFVKRRVLDQVRDGTIDIERVATDPEQCTTVYQTSGGAGVTIMRLSELRHLRGFSELYWGWGCQDSDMFLRMSKIFRTVVFKGKLLHINHAREPLSLGTAELKLVERYRAQRQSVEELCKYYGITKGVGDYSRLFEPRPPETKDECEHVRLAMQSHTQVNQADPPW